MAGAVVFKSNIGRLISATDEALDRAAEIIGGMCESYAKEEVTAAVYDTPETWYVRTGNLRNSISHATEEPHTVVVGATAEYAPYVELGTGIYAKDGKGRKNAWSYQDAEGNWHTTVGMPPRPFIRPAFEKHKSEFKQVLKTEANKIK